MLWLLELPVLLLAFWALLQWGLLLSVRRQREQFLSANQRLDHAAQTTVKEVQQTLAEDFKRARVEHRLKGDTAAELRATAIKIIHANLGPLGLKELRRSLGISSKAPLDRLLVGHLEAALYDLKGRSINNGEVPSAPGGRFYPDTMRIPRIEKPAEHPENMFDENTQVTRR